MRNVPHSAPSALPAALHGSWLMAWLLLALGLLAAPVHGAINPVPCDEPYSCLADPVLTGVVSGPSQVCPGGSAAFTLTESITAGAKQKCYDPPVTYGLTSPSWTWTIAGPGGSANGSGTTATYSAGDGRTMKGGAYTVTFTGTASKDDSDCTGSVTGTAEHSFTIEDPVASGSIDTAQICPGETKSVAFRFTNTSKTCSGEFSWAVTAKGGKLQVTVAGDTSGTVTLGPEETKSGTVAVAVALASPPGENELQLKVTSVTTGTEVASAGALLLAEAACSVTVTGETVCGDEDGTVGYAIRNDSDCAWDYTWEVIGNGVTATADGPTSARIPAHGIFSGTATVTAGGGAAPDGASVTVRAHIVGDDEYCEAPSAIDIGEPTWSCLETPGLEITGGAQSAEELCESGGVRFSVTARTIDGQAKLACGSEAGVIEAVPAAIDGYDWTTTGGQLVANGASADVGFAAPGVYTVKVTVRGSVADGARCGPPASRSRSFTVTVHRRTCQAPTIRWTDGPRADIPRPCPGDLVAIIATAQTSPGARRCGQQVAVVPVSGAGVSIELPDTPDLLRDPETGKIRVLPTAQGDYPIRVRATFGYVNPADEALCGALQPLETTVTLSVPAPKGNGTAGDVEAMPDEANVEVPFDVTNTGECPQFFSYTFTVQPETPQQPPAIASTDGSAVERSAQPSEPETSLAKPVVHRPFSLTWAGHVVAESPGSLAKVGGVSLQPGQTVRVRAFVHVVGGKMGDVGTVHMSMSTGGGQGIDEVDGRVTIVDRTYTLTATDANLCVNNPPTALARLAVAGKPGKVEAVLEIAEIEKGADGKELFNASFSKPDKKDTPRKMTLSMQCPATREVLIVIDQAPSKVPAWMKITLTVGGNIIDTVVANVVQSGKNEVLLAPDPDEVCESEIGRLATGFYCPDGDRVQSVRTITARNGLLRRFDDEPWVAVYVYPDTFRDHMNERIELQFKATAPRQDPVDRITFEARWKRGDANPAATATVKIVPYTVEVQPRFLEARSGSRAQARVTSAHKTGTTRWSLHKPDGTAANAENLRINPDSGEIVVVKSKPAAGAYLVRAVEIKDGKSACKAEVSLGVVYFSFEGTCDGVYKEEAIVTMPSIESKGFLTEVAGGRVRLSSPALDIDPAILPTPSNTVSITSRNGDGDVEIKVEIGDGVRWEAAKSWTARRLARIVLKVKPVVVTSGNVPIYLRGERWKELLNAANVVFRQAEISFELVNPSSAYEVPGLPPQLGGAHVTLIREAIEPESRMNDADLYFGLVGEFEQGELGGEGDRPPGRYSLLSHTASMSTLAHEFGHNLGLLHPGHIADGTRHDTMVAESRISEENRLIYCNLTISDIATAREVALRQRRTP